MTPYKKNVPSRVLEVPCPRCLAPANESCRKKSGRATWPCNARLEAWNAALVSGKLNQTVQIPGGRVAA